MLKGYKWAKENEFTFGDVVVKAGFCLTEGTLASQGQKYMSNSRILVLTQERFAVTQPNHFCTKLGEFSTTIQQILSCRAGKEITAMLHSLQVRRGRIDWIWKGENDENVDTNRNSRRNPK